MFNYLMVRTYAVPFVLLLILRCCECQLRLNNVINTLTDSNIVTYGYDQSSASIDMFASMNKNITVIVNSDGNLQLHETWKAQTTTILKLVPSIDAFWWQGGSRLLSVIKTKLVRNLTDLWIEQGWDKTVPLFFRRQCSDVSGKWQYAVPTAATVWAVFYRPDVLKSLGISKMPNLPSQGATATWDEFLNLCETIKKGGMVPLGIGAKCAFQMAFHWDYINSRINGPEFRHSLMAGNETWTDPRVRNVFTSFQVLFDKGYINADWEEQMCTDVVDDLLKKKKYAMMFYGSWPWGMENLRDNQISWFQFPTIKKGVKIGESAGINLNFQSIHDKPNKAAVKSLMTYFGSFEFQSSYSIYPVLSPNLRVKTEASAYVNNTIRYNDMYTMVDNADSLGSAFDVDTFPEFSIPAMDLIIEWAKRPSQIDSILQRLERLRLEVYVGLVATPQLLQQPGVYFKPLWINMTAPTTGSVIYYTLDGTVPTSDSLMYTGPFLIASPGRTIIRAVARKKDMLDSIRLEAAFVLDFSANIPIHLLTASSLAASQASAAFSLAIMLLLSVLSWRYQSTPVFRSSTPLFLQMMLFGTALVLSSVFCISQNITPDTISQSVGKLICGFQLWLLGVGFVLCMSCMILKTWRIYKIFDNKSLSVMQIPNKELVSRVGLFVATEVLINLVWTASDPLQPTLIADDTQRAWSCRSTNFWPFFAVSVGYKAMLLFAATWLAIQTRNVPSTFNESKQIGVAIYNVTFLSCMTLPLSFITTASASHALRMIGILMSSVVSMLIFFAPKLYIAIMCPDKNVANTAISTADSNKQSVMSQAPTQSNKPFSKLECSELKQFLSQQSNEMDEHDLGRSLEVLKKIAAKVATASVQQASV